MIPDIKRKFTEKFDEDIRFLKGFIDKPKSVGTPFATSPYTGRAMANVIDITSGLPVLEIGPGTGTITRAILGRGVQPEKLYSVEYSEHFLPALKAEFPGVNILHGDALNLDAVLGDRRDMKFDSVISAIPLLNLPMAQRVSYLEDMLTRIPLGRPVIQVTYGPLSPVPAGRGDFSVARADFILRNVPPAHLWTYRRFAG
jgi:phosphatidylethanolamine/phosphatidyl-N-methylethanolamine N-methyltransferase